MIPFIRSISELMAMTESRDTRIGVYKKDKINFSILDGERGKRFIKSNSKKEVDLPDLPKTIKRKWLKNKETVTKFFDDLDYNNQIQKTFELTLLADQNKNNRKDVA